jgi:matrix metalloproteinase-16 (membrane-inserted)
MFFFSPLRTNSVFFLVLCIFSYTLSKSIRISKREIVDDSVQRYLTQFGYMEKTADGAFALRTEESVRNAIKEMQEFAGIPVTGRLDQRTLKLLRTPRCGLPDKNIQTSGRRKRFTLHGQKWPYTNLTWSLRSKNLRDLDSYAVRFVISKALEVWSRHSKLTFTEVDSDRADILIYFVR